ncbi:MULTISPECIES: hypothetical protein [unclassified Coleofasciculus]|uniref:hypothetical protein n=1 Tax=Cyanophyceae TaxID=3028117 RepID=UPI0016863EA3|nr:MULTISPECIES: hypothetical protein [unclassified Coleofasciculus]MBD1838356.1 hypothetical protein [Coleofasciculus sp. FACHB-501]
MTSSPINSGIALRISQAPASKLWGYTQNLLQNFTKTVKSEDGLDRLTRQQEERILLNSLL